MATKKATTKKTVAKKTTAKKPAVKTAAAKTTKSTVKAKAPAKKTTAKAIDNHKCEVATFWGGIIITLAAVGAFMVLAWAIGQVIR